MNACFVLIYNTVYPQILFKSMKGFLKKKVSFPKKP